MTTQTEAHDLIRELEDEAQDNPDDYRWKAAAELRSLEADKDDWKDASFVFKERAVKAEARIAELEAANAELLSDVSTQIKEEADVCIRKLEQAGLHRYQVDRLSGQVSGLMKAYDIAQAHSITKGTK